MQDRSGELGRLGEALEAYLQRVQGAAPESEEEFLRRHEGVRDLLEMFLRKPPGADTGAEQEEGLGVRGKVLGDFELLREVGRGGMGVVYEARQISLARRVALKVLPAQRALHHKRVERFQREAAAAARLRHPNIVSVHAVGLAEGCYFYAMEFVEGETLAGLIERMRGEGGRSEALVTWSTGALERETKVREGARGGAIPTPGRNAIAVAAGIGLRVAEALAYAHEHGVVHRDVKPANILLDREGVPLLADFGLAKEEGADSLSLTGELLGTPHYMSPEQAGGRRSELDGRTDVYSLGATLYELLTLRVPFEGETYHDVLRRIALRDPAPPRKLNPRIPRDLETIVLKALEKDQRRRYASARALAEDLERFLHLEPILARPSGAATRVLKFARREPAKALAVMLGVLLVIGGPLFFGVQQKIARSREETLRKLADEERGNVLRLSAFRKLEELRRQADSLWPAVPEKRVELGEWLTQAEELVALRPTLVSQLETLQARALPLSESERERLRAVHPRYGEVQRSRGRLAAAGRAREVREGRAQPRPYVPDLAVLPSAAGALDLLARWLAFPYRVEFGREHEGLVLARLARERAATPFWKASACENLAWAYLAVGLDEQALAAADEAVLHAESLLQDRPAFVSFREGLVQAVARARDGQEIVDLEEQLASLTAEVDRTVWQFSSEADAWWHDQLRLLIETIDRFADARTGLLEGLAPEFGWGIARRKRWADSVEEQTLHGESAARRWREAVASIQNAEECPRYRGMVIAPQLGLLPIGKDPHSGLWEFAHPQSGTIPERDSQGGLILEEATGLVFVLLPGGMFWMGCQSTDPAAPNYDPQSDPVYDGPVHLVELSPYFVSKYELTQAQWLRLVGTNPSERGGAGGWNQAWTFDGERSLLHPVEFVSWHEAVQVLQRLGMTLPSEAQWEYAARAGTDTPWWTGADPASLEGAANVADEYARENGRVPDWSYETWWDGYTPHAPVGLFAPNPFGLHDVHGNVNEWCLDGFLSGYHELGPTQGPHRDPLVPSDWSMNRSVRGGFWGSSATLARVCERSVQTPTAKSTLGLRPVLVQANPPKEAPFR